MMRLLRPLAALLLLPPPALSSAPRLAILPSARQEVSRNLPHHITRRLAPGARGRQPRADLPRGRLDA
jgi:hypothetical protein